MRELRIGKMENVVTPGGEREFEVAAAGALGVRMRLVRLLRPDPKMTYWPRIRWSKTVTLDNLGFRLRLHRYFLPISLNDR